MPYVVKRYATILDESGRDTKQQVPIYSPVEFDSNGMAQESLALNGLANNAVRVSDGETYDANVISGFRVLLKGSGSLTIVPNTLDAVPIVVTAAELTEMDLTIYNDWPMEASSITAGTGMELLVYI